MLDYKQKYKELRSKFIEATNVSYRLGYADGLKQAQQDQAQMQIQQAQQAQMQMQAAMNGGVAPDGSQGGSPEEQMAMADQGGQGIPQDMGGGEGFQQPPVGAGEEPELAPGEATELDQYINELENLVAKGQKPNVTDLRKVVNELADLRKSQKSRMKSNKKQIVTAQKKLVDNILSKWERESKVTSENLEDVIKEHGLKLD